jgi:serralysin
LGIEIDSFKTAAIALLWGADGNDKLDGGVGNDCLNGDRGNDILTDNDGGDSLLGGEGADEFAIGNSLSNSPSIIKDFQVGSDRLKILRLGATFKDLKIEDSQDGAVIRDRGGAVVVALVNGRMPEQEKHGAIIGLKC